MVAVPVSVSLLQQDKRIWVTVASQLTHGLSETVMLADFPQFVLSFNEFQRCSVVSLIRVSNIPIQPDYFVRTIVTMTATTIFVICNEAFIQDLFLNWKSSSNRGVWE